MNLSFPVSRFLYLLKAGLFVPSGRLSFINGHWQLTDYYLLTICVKGGGSGGSKGVLSIAFALYSVARYGKKSNSAPLHRARFYFINTDSHLIPFLLLLSVRVLVLAVELK